MKDDAKKKRKSFLLSYKKLRLWFYGILTAFGIPIIVATLVEKKDESWLQIIRSLVSGLTGWVVLVIVLFLAIDKAMSIYQNSLDGREAKFQKIREEGEKKLKEEREKHQKELDRLQRNQDRFEREIKNELSCQNWPDHVIEETINRAKRWANKKRKDDE